MEKLHSAGTWCRVKRRGRLLLTAMLALVFVVVSCAFFRISHPQDIEAFFGMAAECHPVWKQFALRRFGAGDSVQELLRRFRPTSREEFGRYGVYSFSPSSNSISFTGLSVVSKDGKLVSAASGSCTWHFTFFTTEDPELEREYAAMVQERHHKNEQRRLEQLKVELQRFFTQHNRWPTDEAEFGWFVIGPPRPSEATLDNWFQARYGLTKAGVSSTRISANPLGITLKNGEAGAVTIALNGEPDLQGDVARPSK